MLLLPLTINDTNSTVTDNKIVKGVIKWLSVLLSGTWQVRSHVMLTRVLIFCFLPIDCKSEPILEPFLLVLHKGEKGGIDYMYKINSSKAYLMIFTYILPTRIPRRIFTYTLYKHVHVYTVSYAQVQLTPLSTYTYN